MSQVCINIAFPDFTAVHTAVKQLMDDARKELPPKFPSLALPTLPSPIMPTINWPTLQAINISIETVSTGLMKFIMAFLQPIIDFVAGFGFSFAWPKIPVLDIDLPELLSSSFNSLVATVKEKFADIKAFLASVPGIPVPLFQNISIPELEIVEAIQALVRSYYTSLMTFATSVLNAVKSVLGGNPFNFGLSLPTFPTLPTTFEGLLELIGIPDIQAALAAGADHIKQLFASLSIPSFPGFELSLPDWDQMFPDFVSGTIQLWQLAKTTFLAMVMSICKMFKDLADILQQFIPFSFTTICFPAVSG